MSSAIPSNVPLSGSQPAAPRTSAPQNTADKMKDKAAELGQQASDMAQSARDAAQVQLEQARESAMQYYGQGREKAMELSHQVETYVRQEPVKAMLYAAGVGFALGFLLIRR